MKSKLRAHLKDADWPELSPEQMKEIEDWVKDQLKDGGTITKDEAHDALQAFADKHGFDITAEMWEEAEDAFDYVDANGDGEIDLDELMAVLEEHGPPPKEGHVQLKKRNLIQIRNKIKS